MPLVGTEPILGLLPQQLARLGLLHSLVLLEAGGAVSSHTGKAWRPPARPPPRALDDATPATLQTTRSS
jgi:hypothetical protein